MKRVDISAENRENGSWAVSLFMMRNIEVHFGVSY